MYARFEKILNFQTTVRVPNNQFACSSWQSYSRTRSVVESQCMMKLDCGEELPRSGNLRIVSSSNAVTL
jgi:hypothetical protein